MIVEIGKFFSIKYGNASLCAYPDISFFILRDGCNIGLNQAIIGGVVFKRIALPYEVCGKSKTKQNTEPRFLLFMVQLVNHSCKSYKTLPPAGILLYKRENELMLFLFFIFYFNFLPAIPLSYSVNSAYLK